MLNVKRVLCYFLYAFSVSLFPTKWKLSSHWNFFSCSHGLDHFKATDENIHATRRECLLDSPDNAALWSPFAIMLVTFTPSNP